MFILIEWIILAGLYSFLFAYFIPLSPWFLFLWIPLGMILSILTIVLLLIIFLSLCDPKHPEGKIRHFFARSIIGIAIYIQNFRIKVEGRENIPSGTFAGFANHKSMMDPLLCYYTIGKPNCLIGKKELFKMKIMKLFVRVYKAIPMNREDNREALKSLKVAIDCVKSGYPITVFPEGGIKSRETDLMVDIKPGAYKLATKAEAPILPISIIGNSQVHNKKFFQRKNIKVIFHKPIPYEEYKDMNTTQIGEMIFEIINNGIKNEQTKENTSN